MCCASQDPRATVVRWSTDRGHDNRTNGNKRPSESYGRTRDQSDLDEQQRLPTAKRVKKSVYDYTLIVIILIGISIL